jgi:hypothetical protein
VATQIRNGRTPNFNNRTIPPGFGSACQKLDLRSAARRVSISSTPQSKCRDDLHHSENKIKIPSAH